MRPFGAGVATLVASSLGTVFFLWMVVVTLGRLNKRSGLGATIIMGPQEIPNIGWMTIFQDPTGCTIAIFQSK